MKQNAQEDVTKGQHVKTQLVSTNKIIIPKLIFIPSLSNFHQGLWDTFLDTRIRLQKAVSIANSFPQVTFLYDFIHEFMCVGIIIKSR